jgi:hypothetical protein
MKVKILALGIIFLCVIPNISAQERQTYSVNKAGTLISLFTREGADGIKQLKLTGKINAVDFRHLRDEFKSLEVLDLSGADVKMYIGKEGTDENSIPVYKANYIPRYAFKGKSSLKKIIIPFSVQDIDKEAFKDCNNLEIIQLSNQKVPHIGLDAISDTITTVFVPISASDNYRRNEQWSNFSIIEGEPVSLKVQIGKLGSLQNEILEAGMQPNNINYLTIEGKLDDDDFLVIRNYMPNLVHLDISKTMAEKIPEFTFSQKKHLIRIDLPQSLKKIEQRAFSGCSKLGGTLLLPPTLTSIGYGAFIDCTHLTHVKALGNKITAIGDNIFGTDKSKLIFCK